ncbi:MAG: Gfo/Idh/MocA family oxidoreductase [Armatimonadota bacterium]
METLKVGILGLRRGSVHLRNFLSLDNVQVIGGADLLEKWRQPAREALDPQGGKVVETYEELLAMEPDAIVVASNGRCQAEHACMAMEAGCHVLSEVPGAFHEEEFIRLRDCVERTGMTYMLAENCCWWDFFRYWRRWVVENRFGPISLAEGEYVHYLARSLQDAEGNRYTPGKTEGVDSGTLQPIWRADQPPIQYLTHDLGPLLEILDDRAVSVTCKSGPWHSKEGPLRTDGQFALFETAKGTLIRILVSLSTWRPGEHRYRIFGPEGGAEYFSYEGYTRYFDRDYEEKDGWQRMGVGAGRAGTDMSGGHGGADLRVARGFAHTILEGRSSPIDIYRTIEYSLPGILANRSARLGGQTISIPDMRRRPFEGTDLWNHISLPEDAPEPVPYGKG